MELNLIFLVINIMFGILKLFAYILSIIIMVFIQIIKLLIYIIKNVIILDLFTVSLASSYCIYKLFKVSTTSGLIKAVIAGVVIGLISLLLTKAKYIGKVLAEAYGAFWGILLFLVVQHFGYGKSGQVF